MKIKNGKKNNGGRRDSLFRGLLFAEGIGIHAVYFIGAPEEMPRAPLAVEIVRA